MTLKLGAEYVVKAGGWTYQGTVVGVSPVMVVLQVGAGNVSVPITSEFTPIKSTPSRRTTPKEATK